MSRETYNPEEDYVPKHSQRDYENVFRRTSYYEQWIMYSRMMQGNPYVKNYLARRQEGKCLFCGKKLFEDMNYNIVHHRDYMNLCGQHDSKATLVRYPKPTKRNPDKTILVPNCAYCKWHTIDDFDDCIDNKVYVHVQVLPHTKHLVTSFRLRYTLQNNRKPDNFVK